MKKHLLSTALVLCCALSGLSAERTDEVLKKSGFAGGVVVQLDCGNGELLADIHQQRPNSLAHGLVRTEDRMADARQTLRKAGAHGKVTVGGWDGKMIPFVDNFVNLLVADAGTTVPREEILRVLAPMGTAIIGKEKLVKPRPSTIDDWPQYLYDQTGNAVSKDSAVRPPLGHIQWVGSPRWSRHHETMSSVSACVSGDNKVFYIFDEGSRFSPLLPCHWKLIARDAFNGTVLWKRDLPEWFPNLHGLKSGPATLPRRLVSDGDKLYVTLGIRAPVSVLDAESGKTLKVLKGTEETEEIVHDGMSLFLVADRNPEKKELQQYPRSGGAKWELREKQIIRYDLDRNKVAWEKPFDWVAPMTLAGSRNKLYFFDGKSVVALEKFDGGKVWASEELPVFKMMPTFFAPKLVVQGGTVLFAGGEDFKRSGSRGTLRGLSTEMGKTLWTAPNPASGYRSPEDLFVIDGEAWAGDVYYHRWDGTEDDATGEFTGVNISSGSVDKKINHVDQAYWFHHRCHMAKATENYLITSRTGTEFIDLKTGKWTLHHWIRGACLYGIMPANGMIYAPQHPCACYIGAKMFGFTSMAPKSASHASLRHTPEDQRLTTVKEAAFADGAKAAVGAEWPTYRADNTRSGEGRSIAEPGGVRWSLDLGGKLTPPVIASGKVVVALKDKNEVVAVDAGSGKLAWRFLPGGQVDSPPTLYKNRAYFGSADGFVYCLDLADGSLIWKFQAAPSRAMHMYFEKLESTHPVHGNVMILDDKLYTVAGRSMFTDGGIRFLILDAATGKKLAEHIMDEKVPGSDEELQMQQEVLNMPQALPDLLSTNGKKIFMRYQQFDMEGKRTKIDYTRKLFGKVKSDIAASNEPALTDQKGEDAHLFSSTGFLDDSWWHRTYWIYGKNQASGWQGHTRTGAGGTPSGRVINFNEDTIFTWGRLQRYFKWTPKYEYSLYASDRDHKKKWDVMVPILVRAMLLAGDDLYIMGPKEIARQPGLLTSITTEDTRQRVIEQEKLMDGKSGSILLKVDATTGRMVSGFNFNGAPEFDGMAGAYGRIYLSMMDGTLQCLYAQGSPLTPIAAEDIDAFNKDAAIPGPPQKGKKKVPKKKNNK